MKLYQKWILAGVVLGTIVLSPHKSLAAAVGELSVTGSYSKSNLGNNAYSTSRRYMAALGVNLTSVTEIELSYTDTKSFFNYDPVQTTTVTEQALSLSLIQSLVPSSWIFQPYVKVGGAQYNRQQSGTISGVPTTPTESKSPSAVLGGGVRIYLLMNFSLEVEGVTFLPDMKISQAKDNFSATGGVSWHF